MSLHNRYPSYFYKRGNLFNTYLGHTDKGPPPANPEGTGASANAARKRRPSSRGVRRRPSGASREAVAGALLARFAKEHLSLPETERLLRLIAADVGIHVEQRRDLGLRLPTELGEFVRDHVPAERAASYLSTLNQRLALGHPLIQK
jgi:hypothetical protein